MYKRNKRGFTLIELLVVVLIIGILAAVALPQYKLAVEKSRTTEAITILNSLQKVADLYVLEHGYQDVQLVGDGGIASKLDIDVENSLSCDQDSGIKCRSKNFYYDANCFFPSFCRIEAGRAQNGIFDAENEETLEYYFSMYNRNGKWTRKCGTIDAYPYGEKLCKSLQTQGWGYNEYK